jgi:hypothetical protein
MMSTAAATTATKERTRANTASNRSRRAAATASPSKLSAILIRRRYGYGPYATLATRRILSA